MAFVLDNSVVTGWYLPDQSTNYSQTIAARLESDKALVPALWQQELANVLKTACTRGKLKLETAREILDTLGTLPIEIDTGAGPANASCLNWPCATSSAATMLSTWNWPCDTACQLQLRMHNSKRRQSLRVLAFCES